MVNITGLFWNHSRKRRISMQLSKKWFQKGIAALLSAALMIGHVVSVSAAELPMKQE